MRYQIGQQVIGAGTPFTHNGLQYPGNWLTLSTPEERAAIGAVLYVEPVPSPPSIEEVKSIKIRQIEQWRDDACYANVTAHSRQWQADKRSQELLANAILAASVGLSLPQAWRDSSNSDMPISSIADLVAIAGAAALATQTAYVRSWELKAEVNKLTATVDSIEKIVW